MSKPLISAAELQQQINSPDVVIFDTRFSLADTEYGTRAYAAGHIPGAFYLHLDRNLSSPITPTSGRHPLPSVDQLVELFQSHGVSSKTHVVAYDDAAGMFAARCWWLLRWLGHTNVSVLDGGLPAWIRSGGAVDNHAPQKAGRGSFVAQPQFKMLMSADEVLSGLNAQQFTLCDARAPERYRGDVEPIDPVAGHVPGAVNLPFSQNLNADGCFKDVAELQRLHTLKENKPLVHMCGSGVTACHNILAAAVAGLPMPALYAGSWSEWIRNPDRPIARG